VFGIPDATAWSVHASSPRLTALAAALASATVAYFRLSDAAAHEAPGLVEPPPEAALPSRDVTHPNRKLLVAAALVGGSSYVISAGIAVESNHPGDGYLAIPLAGPWIDLAVRPPCDVTSNCAEESGNRVLLVGSGALQAIGAFMLVAAFVFPETVRLVTLAKNSSGASLTLSPVTLGRQGYALSAVGQF
jgi:hypothetical protein